MKKFGFISVIFCACMCISINSLQAQETDFNYVLSGDVDLNGVVDFFDIGPFIAVIQSGVYQPEADVNQDGVVSFIDISWWICILSGQPCFTL